MNNLKIEKIPQCTYNNVHFAGGTLFSLPTSQRAFLLSEQGRAFFADRRLFDSLKNGTIDENFVKKLDAKGFVKEYQAYDVRKCPKHIPVFFIIDFTTKCNMNCYYCLRHFEDSGEIISEEQLKDILDYIIAHYKSNRLSYIDIQPWGGEPLLALDRIVYMRKYLDEHEVNANITIQTNAILLNEENIAILESNRIGIGVSIDGCKEIHDLHRKNLRDQPTFDVVEGNIKKYTDITGKRVGTISVVSKMSLPYLEASIERLVKQVNVSCLKLNFMHPNSDLFDDSAVVTEEDIELFWIRVMDILIRLQKEGYRVIESNLADKACNLLGCGGGNICHSHGCTGGYTFVSFSQDGKIYPCEMIGVPEYQLGDIHDNKDLSLLISNAISKNPYFCEKICDECKTCPWHYFCRGGCTAAARFNRKQAGEIDDKECASNKVIYPKLIQLLLEDPNIISRLTNGKVEFI